MEAIGTYDELVSSGKDFAKLLHSLQDEKKDDKDKLPIMPRRISARVCIFKISICRKINPPTSSLKTRKTQTGANKYLKNCKVLL